MNPTSTTSFTSAPSQTLDASAMAALLERINRLEAESTLSAQRAKRWRNGAIALAAATVAITSLAATQSARTPDVIRARRFEVVDANDKVVLLAGIGQNGGQLDVWGNGGTNVLRLGANGDGGDLAVWNSKQQGVAAIYATAQGGRIEATMGDGSGAAVLRAEGAAPALAITDAQDRPRIVATSAGGSSGISVRSEGGQELIALGASEGSGGIVRVAQPDGTIAAQMLAFDKGGLVECASRTGGRAAMFGATAADAGGSLLLYGPDGIEAVSAHAKTEQGSRLSLLGATGQPSAVIESGADNTGLFAVFADGKRVVGLGGSAAGGLLNLSKPDGRAVVVAGAATDADGGAISVRGGSGSQLVRLGVDRVGAGEVAVYDGTGTRKRVLNATAAQP